MRVLLDATARRHGPSGTAVYLERLAPALREAGAEVIEAVNERRAAPGSGSSRRNAAEDVRWVQDDLRRLARRHRADVVHHPLPAHTAAGPRPQVVTVHDLAFEELPEAFDPRFRRFARVTHRLAARRAAAVVVPSRATADELAARWGVADAVVAPHGPGQELPRRERRPPEHLLYVGDAEPRKDLPVLLAAYARYRATATRPLPLVLAGSAFAVDSGVRIVARPDAAALADLHAGAAALVHPSRHEGFGLTVLEALAAGTPVIAADVPAIREVAGDAARYVPPGDAAALAAALADPPAGPVAAPAHLTWAASAERHLEAYRRARTRG